MKTHSKRIAKHFTAVVFFAAAAVSPSAVAHTEGSDHAQQVENTVLTRINSVFAGGAASYTWDTPAVDSGAELSSYNLQVWDFSGARPPTPAGSFPTAKAFLLPAGVSLREVDIGSSGIEKTENSFVLTGLQPATTYAVRIGGENNESETHHFSEDTTVYIPPAPANVGVSLSGTQLAVNWDPVAGASGYRVRIATNAQDWISENGAFGVAVGDVTRHTFDVAAGRGYNVAIAAVTADDVGVGAWSVAVNNASGALSADATLAEFVMTGEDGTDLNLNFHLPFVPGDDSKVRIGTTVTTATADFRIKATPTAGARMRITAGTQFFFDGIANVLDSTPLAAGELSPLITAVPGDGVKVGIAVLSEDGSTELAYQVFVSRASNDATMREFGIQNPSGVEQNSVTRPPFAPGDATQLVYAVETAYHNIHFVAVPHRDGYHSVRFISGNDDVTKSGRVEAEISPKYAMDAGATRKVDIIVTALDGVTSLTYTFFISRTQSGSDNNNLSNIELSGGATLDQTFSPTVTAYTATAPADAAEITVTPTASVSGGMISVNGASVASGDASDGIALENNTPRKIEITVKAPNGKYNLYTLTVTRFNTPTPPADISVAAVNNGAQAQWAQNAGAKSYRIRWRVSAGPGDWMDAAGADAECNDADAGSDDMCGVVVAAGMTSHAISGLTNATQYDVAVASVNAVGVTWSAAIPVTPAAAAEARLSALMLSDSGGVVELTPAFDADTEMYSAIVGVGETSMTFSPTAMHPAAGVGVDGETAAPFIPATPTGISVIPIVVTAENNGATKTYTVNVTALPNVSALTLADADDASAAFPLSPEFSNNVFAYRGGSLGAVGNATANLSLTATFTGDAAAKIGLAAEAIADRAALTTATAASVALTEGENVAEISFAAAAADLPVVYAITVYRAPAGAVVPEAPLNVDLLPADGGFSITWSPPGNDGGGEIIGYKVRHKLGGASAFSAAADADSLSEHALSGLTNRELYEVQVAAENSAGVGEYSASASGRPAAADDATLIDLTVSTGTLKPPFAFATRTYSVDVADTVERITVTAIPAHINAAVSGDGAVELGIGENTAGVSVTAADNAAMQEYVVIITRATPGVSDFSLIGAELDMPFDLATLAYTAAIGHDTAALTFAATVSDGATATIGIAGKPADAISGGGTVVALEFATREIQLIYTLGAVSITYTFTIMREQILPGLPGKLSAVGVKNSGDLLVEWYRPPAVDTGGPDIARADLSYQVRWRAFASGENADNVDLGDSGFAGGDIFNVAPDGRRYTIANLTDDMKYLVQVRSQNVVGDGEWRAVFGFPGEFLLNLDNSADINNENIDWRDGVYLARYLIGIRYDPGIEFDDENQFLTTGLQYQFTQPGSVAVFGNSVDENLARLDVNENGVTDAADGFLIARYLLGVRGDALTAAATSLPAEAVTKNILAILPHRFAQP